jgi:hypothetical protein
MRGFVVEDYVVAHYIDFVSLTSHFVFDYGYHVSDRDHVLSHTGDQGSRVESFR